MQEAPAEKCEGKIVAIRAEAEPLELVSLTLQLFRFVDRCTQLQRPPISQRRQSRFGCACIAAAGVKLTGA